MSCGETGTIEPALTSFRLTQENEIVFRPGAIEDIPGWLAARGSSRVLLVTDRGLVRSGVADHVSERLRSAALDVQVFDEVEPNPTIPQVENAARVLIESGSHAIVGLGGGSAMDCAKVAALLATNGGRVQDYEGVIETVAALPPLICVPTTCGTGSEVTFSALVARGDGMKIPIIGKALRPPLAVLDPTLLATLPPDVAAASAVDAICHATESFLNLLANPFCDALDRHALALLAPCLQAGTVGGDPSARERLLVGANLAGIAISANAANLCHAMSYPITARYRIPHGVAVGILLPSVLAFNEGAQPEREREVASLLGAPGVPVAEAVAELFASVGIPTDLRATLATQEDVPTLVAQTMPSRNVALNPRPVSKDDVGALFRSLITA